MRFRSYMATKQNVIRTPLILSSLLMFSTSKSFTIPQNSPANILVSSEESDVSSIAITSSSSIQKCRYAAGVVTQLKTSQINHIFALENMGKAPLIITDIKPSCGCTNTILGNGVPEQLPLTLAAGQKVMLHTTVNLAYLRPGPLDKFVYVFLKGREAPDATLEITATLQPPVTLTPSVLKFGPVSAGMERSQMLTLTVDPQLVSSMATARVVSTNPDLQVQQIDAPPHPALPATQATANEPTSAPPPSTTNTPISQTTNPDDHPYERTYRITVSPKARLGMLTGTIAWIPGGTGDTEAGNIVTVPVEGEVDGDISAAPEVVAFGTVHQGQSAHQRIVLTGKTADALAHINVSCASPVLSARLSTEDGRVLMDTSAPPTIPPTGIAPAKGKVPRKLLLDVTLSDQASAGSLITQVIVTLTNGQQLVLPVYIYVS